MKIHNRAGELVELPASLTREQVDAALAALGIPNHVGLRKVSIGVHSATVDANVLGEDGRNTFGVLSVEIPYRALPADED